MAFETESERDVTKATSLDDFLVENKEATHMLRMRGSAMAHAGILDGDLVLVERGADASAKDIVAVVADGKYLIRRLRDIAAQTGPARADRQKVQVEGVVRAVIRKY